MGVHYVKDALVRDGQLDPERPESLLYEMRNGKLFLLAKWRTMGSAWVGVMAALATALVLSFPRI